MLFTIDRESLLNKLRIVEKITIQRGIQPVLANILFDAKDNELTLSATDLDLYVVVKTTVVIKEEGKITLPAKKLVEIASKLPDKPVEFSLNKETNVVKITCGASKFEIVGISAAEFPVSDEDFSSATELTIDTAPFLKSIKNTIYAVAGYENRNIISGVLCKIQKNKLEMAATDGNRLTRTVEEVQTVNENETKIVIPSKTLQEFSRICSFVTEEQVQLFVSKAKLLIKSNSFAIRSRLLEGEYPPYEQLIPKSTTYEVTISREELINSLERVSCMVNERTSVVKFDFSANKLSLKAETPNSGASEDEIICDFPDESLTISFNYKYVLDSLRTMESGKTKIGMTGSATATVFKPEDADNYICLIMPVNPIQMR